MITPNRIISFSQAIREAQSEAMKIDKKVFIFGLGVDKTAHIFSTTKDLKQRFGKNRIFDTPASEQALTMFAAGAANANMRPILIHQRLDFMIYTFDQLINWIALWSFKSSGKSKMPLVIRAVVGRGWGQGPQHAKCLHSMFAHVPGLKVVMPSSPSEAKGLLLSSIFSNDPVIFIEYRSLYNSKEFVPEKPYFLDLNSPNLRLKGNDFTVVSIGAGVLTCLKASEILKKDNISFDLFDCRSVNSFKMNSIFTSLKKTKRLLVVEDGWSQISFSSEVITRVAETDIKFKSPPIRIAWPNSHIPMSSKLEKNFYFNERNIVSKIKNNL
jgi:pyruvate dehydrogenase E1 component beta subunit